MKINSEFDLVNYGVVVEMIADGYFANGQYDPYLGTLNAMRIFWNNCVVESELDDQHPHNISNILDMQEIVKNENFITAFNAALVVDFVRFDFANAYDDAMEIVDYRKSPLLHIFDDIKGYFNSLIKDTEKLVTPENVEMLKTLAESIKDGNSFESSMDKIIEQKSTKA